MDIGELRRRYLALCPYEPMARPDLQGLQDLLNVTIPEDVWLIADFFTKGRIGNLEVSSFLPSGIPPTVGESTLRFRKACGIPESMMIISELDGSFIALDTCERPGRATVFWCEDYHAHSLKDLDSFTPVASWDSFAQFFEERLKFEEEWVGRDPSR